MAFDAAAETDGPPRVVSANPLGVQALAAKIQSLEKGVQHIRENCDRFGTAEDTVAFRTKVVQQIKKAVGLTEDIELGLRRVAAAASGTRDDAQQRVVVQVQARCECEAEGGAKNAEPRHVAVQIALSRPPSSMPFAPRSACSTSTTQKIRTPTWKRGAGKRRLPREAEQPAASSSRSRRLSLSCEDSPKSMLRSSRCVALRGFALDGVMLERPWRP